MLKLSVFLSSPQPKPPTSVFSGQIAPLMAIMTVTVVKLDFNKNVWWVVSTPTWFYSIPVLLIAKPPNKH